MEAPPRDGSGLLNLRGVDATLFMAIPWC